MIPVNLISNPNFEARRWNENGDTVEMNTVPWNIINTGGDGWKLEKIPMGKLSLHFFIQLEKLIRYLPFEMTSKHPIISID